MKKNWLLQFTNKGLLPGGRLSRGLLADDDNPCSYTVLLSPGNTASPCVTGIPNVATLVRTGDELTVDGCLGIVTKHS
jgi:phosphohistidine swiveling domain-containing protein